MKTTLVIFAVLSLALVGCGKKDKSSGGGVKAFTSSNYVSNQGVLLVIPQLSAPQTAPIIEVNNEFRLNVSQSSSTEAKMAIQQMYANQSAYKLKYQDQQVRKFAVRVTGSCSGMGMFNNGGYNNYNQYNNQYNNQYGYGQNNYNQYGYCQSGSQFIIQSIAP